MEHLQTYFWPFMVAQAASLLLLWAAYRVPRFSRFLFFLLFAWACAINLRTAILTPGMYLEYAPMALPFYADFINGWFSEHITLMVSLIAAGQGFIATGMLLKGAWMQLACLGAIVFLFAIIPLGVGAGFPFSLTVSWALILVLRGDHDPDYLWKVFYKRLVHEYK